MSMGEKSLSDAEVIAASRGRTRRSFLVGGAGAIAGAGLYGYLNLSAENEDQPSLLRRVFDFNAEGSRDLFQEHALSPIYPLSRAENLRVNGIFGLKKMLVAESYRLQLVGTVNAASDKSFVRDVTAWEYRYAAVKAKEDPGHDTKTDPNKERMTLSADASLPEPSIAKGGEQETRGNTEPQKGPGPITEMNLSSARMAPAGTEKRMMAEEAGGGSNSPQQQDDNHLGRTPRGMEESGESDSTLRAGTPGLLLKSSDLMKFPRHELVTQFKCIEGWSQVVHWGGIRFADFLEAYPPALIDGKEPKYAYLETPDGDYYVGHDLKVLRHPQTLLVTEMMGQPLTQFHGAPLRLHTPLRYGYKQIKRIGLIAYTNDKPDDYWTKLGYDWYAGL